MRDERCRTPWNRPGTSTFNVSRQTHSLDTTLVPRIKRPDLGEPFPRGPHIPAHLLEDEHCLRLRPDQLFRSAGEGVFVRKGRGHEGEETSECEALSGCNRYNSKVGDARESKAECALVSLRSKPCFVSKRGGLTCSCAHGDLGRTTLHPHGGVL